MDEGALWVFFYEGTNPIHEASTLMTYSLPPDPPPNTIALGVCIPAYEFGVGDTNIQSICMHAQS